MRLWLLDADVIIDLLELDIFDKLVRDHEVYVVTTVIDNEVEYFYKNGDKTTQPVLVNLRSEYVEKGLIKELSATVDDLKKVLDAQPPIKRGSLDPGELESLAVLLKEDDEIILCSCDAAAIRTLPLLNLSHCGISVESLLKKSGLYKPGLKDKHTDEYFNRFLSEGQADKIYYFKS